MSSIELIYFPLHGLAGLIRVMAKDQQLEFVDTFMSIDDWPKYKETTPFGKLPLLKIEGVTIAQSKTIARFLARRLNLLGSNDLETACVEQLVDQTTDIKSDSFSMIYNEWVSFLIIYPLLYTNRSINKTLISAKEGRFCQRNSNVVKMGRRHVK